MQVVRKTGAFSIAVLASLGRAAILLLHMLISSPVVVRRYKLLIRQIYRVGLLTLPIIIVAAVFVGMVLAL